METGSFKHKNCVIDNIEKYSLNLSKKEKKFIENGQSKLKEITMSSNVCWYQGNVGASFDCYKWSAPHQENVIIFGMAIFHGLVQER